jgi:hypothetical protein
MLYEANNPQASKVLAAAIVKAVEELDAYDIAASLNDYRQRALDILHAQALEPGARLTVAPAWARFMVAIGIEIATGLEMDLSVGDHSDWKPETECSQIAG